MKAHLSPDEILRAAVACLIDGVEQQVVASVLGVNIGRVNEAVRAIDYTLKHAREVFEVARGDRTISPKNGKNHAPEE
jgi:hypothetical protein